MAGLLDFVQTPEGQGLLSAAFGGLAAAGRRGVGPLNAIGAAGAAGLQGYSQAQDTALRRTDQDLTNQMLGLKINQAKQAAADSDALRGFDFSKFYQTPEQQAVSKYGPGDQATANIGQFQPRFDSQGMAQAMLASGQPALMQQGMGMLTKANEPVSLKKDEQLLLKNPDGTYKTVASNLVPEIKNGYIVQDGKGGFKIDPDLYKAELQLKATGAPKVSVAPVVKVGQTFGEDVAKAGATQMMGMIDAARSAPQAVDNANQILNALDTGKVMAGPGTKWKITASQMFGGNQDSLNATRATIQGLAQMSLGARKSLSGQGAISDSETSLLKKAVSGDIDDMTTGEIRLIVNGAKKNAQYVYDQGRIASDALSRMPEVQSIQPAFRLPDMPAQPAQQVNIPGSTMSGGGWSAVKR